MPSPPLPAAFAHLPGEPNRAADAALVEVLPELEPFAQAAALEILIRRGDPSRLADVVGRFDDCGAALQRLILARAGGLSPGFRIAILSASLPYRASAIEMIVSSHAARSAYLLADALRSTCRRTRELAATGLHKMTTRLLERLEARPSLERFSFSCTGSTAVRSPSSGEDSRGLKPAARNTETGNALEHSPFSCIAQPPSFPPSEGGMKGGFRSAIPENALIEPVALNTEIDGLVEALSAGVERWEIHRQPQVLTAALSLGDRVECTIVNKLRQRRTTIARILDTLIAGATDPRLAGSVLRALAIPELRRAAAGAVSRAKDGAFLQALLAESWLLADPAIQQGCRGIRDGRWLEHLCGTVYTLNGPAVAGAVRLLASSGVSHQRKVEVFGELMGCGRDEVRRAAVWQLVGDHSDSATELLGIVAARPGDRAASMAAREVRSRGPGRRVPASAYGVKAESVGASQDREAFERWWLRFDELKCEERARAHDAMRRDVKDIGLRLRERLSSSEALDRVRALRIAQSLGLVKELEQSLYRAASDADPVVRSLVISALAHLPGPTSVRLLRNAVNDPSNRVQANAIETLDRLDAADRVQLTEPKLRSPNSRVRANAARSLLRAGLCQGGETLLDMLEDSSSTHRLSALWVVEKSGLRTALPRVANLSRTDPDQRVRARAKRVLAALSGDRTTDERPPQAECVYPRVRHLEVNR